MNGAHIYEKLATPKIERLVTAYISVELIATQSLREQGETEDARMQKADVSGGGVLPRDTTQPNAT